MLAMLVIVVLVVLGVSVVGYWRGRQRRQPDRVARERRSRSSYVI